MKARLDLEVFTDLRMQRDALLEVLEEMYQEHLIAHPAKDKCQCVHWQRARAVIRMVKQ